MDNEPFDRAQVYLRPLAFLEGDDASAAVAAAGQAAWLVGGPTAFASVELIIRTAPRAFTSRTIAVADLAPVLDQMDAATAAEAREIWTRLTTPRAPLRLSGGRELALDRMAVMGIVNVTPDSFSDGGLHEAPAIALDAARRMVAAGADILDIGGESTRPGSEAVPPDEEMRRVLPVIEGAAGFGAVLSLDSRNAATMAAGVAAGAHVINDVSALTHDKDALAVAARLGVPVILMHALGDPKTMQEDPRYDHVLLDVYDYLAARVRAAVEAGIPVGQIVIDPGIGFGKTLDHNLALIRGMAMFHGLGCPILLGVSRKSFIGRITGVTEPAARLPGSLAVAVEAARQGIQILRVHDVAETVQALTVAAALRQ